LLNCWKQRVERFIYERVDAKFWHFYCFLLNVLWTALKYQRENTRRSFILCISIVHNVLIATYVYDDLSYSFLHFVYECWVCILTPVSRVYNSMWWLGCTLNCIFCLSFWRFFCTV
jgi:hypothetical protein